MKQEILDVYGKFDINNLPDFFDNLIYLSRKYKKNFYILVFLNYFADLYKKL